MSEYEDIDPSALGPNMWLVDEMYRRYRENPEGVDEKWREFFEDFRPRLGEGESSGRTTAASKEAPGARKVTIPEGAERIRFGAERVVKNMKASLEVPTATSFRFVPAKLLEENRRVINRFLSAGGGGKVSFTHLIGYAVLRALESVPVMKSSYLEVEGEPYVLRPEIVNLGLAVDVEKEDGSHSLLVPNIKAANDMDFSRFWTAYEDVIRKVRTNKLTPDDFSGTTVTITNPGTIGTQLSVPRLLRGQGLIVGVGRIDYPAEWQGADPSTLATLGVGKLIGVTSTYDHRVIQGAESGLFLAKLEKAILGLIRLKKCRMHGCQKKDKQKHSRQTG